MKKYLEHQQLMDMHLDRKHTLVDEYVHIPLPIGTVVQMKYDNKFGIISNIDTQCSGYALLMIDGEHVWKQAWIAPEAFVVIESPSPKSIALIASHDN